MAKISVSALAGVGLIWGLGSIDGCMKRNQNAQSTANQANGIDDDLKSVTLDSAEYSILGVDTIRITDGDISYRYNLASQIISVRSSLGAQNSDGVSTVTFNQLANPDYIKKITKTACQIATDLAPERYKKIEWAKYPDDWKVQLKTTYAQIQKFHELHCGGIS